jgi:hypothetical protein
MSETIQRICKAEKGATMESGARELGSHAYNEFINVGRNRAVQLVATNLLLSTDNIHSKVLALLKTVNGFPPEKDQEEWDEFAADLIEWAKDEHARRFQGIRQSSLVSACSAVEYSAKCLFVARAELEPASLDAISTKRFSVSLGDFVATTTRDRFFALADKLFQETDSKWHFDKFSNYVKTIAPDVHGEYFSQTQDTSKNDFNEVFSVRNCIVHHGARATNALSRFNGFVAGNPINVTVECQKRYLRALTEVAGAIAFITPPRLPSAL